MLKLRFSLVSAFRISALERSCRKINQAPFSRKIYIVYSIKTPKQISFEILVNDSYTETLITRYLIT